MLLYFSPGACSLANHIALIEAGLPHGLMLVDHDKRTKDGRDYLTINPRGFVPALQIEDGRILTENLVILAYIADRSGALIPQGEFGRWRTLEAVSYMTTTLHGNLTPFFKNAPDDQKEKAGEAVARGLAILSDQMSDEPFLLGQSMSIADPYLFWVLRAASRFGIAVPENLSAFLDRMNREPAVVQAVAEEDMPQSSSTS